MAKKEMWTDETLAEELSKAHDALATIPHRHVRKMHRALRLLERHHERSLLNVRGSMEEVLKSTASIHGQIASLRYVSATLEAILNGTFRGSEELSEVDDAREQWARGQREDEPERDWDER